MISYWLWYRVGSRNEKAGITGISHWTEHMMFKGTDAFPNGVLDKTISRDGGYWNAMTYMDWTTYFSTMPADKGELILRVEADRMQNGIFASEDVDSERSVIIAEREGNENSPMFRLDEAVQAAAYQKHAYQYEVIGSMEDLERINREDLYTHYKTYYVPNNAVICVAGDFETEAMIKQIKDLFGSIPRGPELPIVEQAEPKQKEEKRLTVKGPGETPFLRASYHAPETTSEDFFILTVLDSLLTGASNLNLFGGGISNKTSLLYKELVQKEMAVSVAGGLQATIDPFLYSIVMTIHPNHQPEDLITVLDQQIESVQNKLPEKSALARAVKQARALFAYGSESITNQAFWLGFSEMFDDYDWFTSYLDQLAAVTPQDVQRIARKYLRPENRILGIYLPDGNGGAQE
ncbi:MAG: insulinase family protein [Chloroflexi bacterium]|nr:insulinase family protein [Chloroflexota bacterium]MBT3671117.1 insulinase family protein [Chloroflexota bacterium]MBT4003140.1 insulinase family protein [Chloroflexota bacterium]MBT4304424.1 insulinase family protein [Chloroflexota bacterium]MBT4682626.1 insulinase family protein [Chloroflexota bacterium]